GGACPGTPWHVDGSIARTPWRRRGVTARASCVRTRDGRFGVFLLAEVGEGALGRLELGLQLLDPGTVLFACGVEHGLDRLGDVGVQVLRRRGHRRGRNRQTLDDPLAPVRDVRGPLGALRVRGDGEDELDALRLPGGLARPSPLRLLLGSGLAAVLPVWLGLGGLGLRLGGLALLLRYILFGHARSFSLEIVAW